MPLFVSFPFFCCNLIFYDFLPSSLTLLPHISLISQGNFYCLAHFFYITFEIQHLNEENKLRWICRIAKLLLFHFPLCSFISYIFKYIKNAGEISIPQVKKLILVIKNYSSQKNSSDDDDEDDDDGDGEHIYTCGEEIMLRCC